MFLLPIFAEHVWKGFHAQQDTTETHFPESEKLRQE